MKKILIFVACVIMIILSGCSLKKDRGISDTLISFDVPDIDVAETNDTFEASTLTEANYDTNAIVNTDDESSSTITINDSEIILGKNSISDIACALNIGYQYDTAMECYIFTDNEVPILLVHTDDNDIIIEIIITNIQSSNFIQNVSYCGVSHLDDADAASETLGRLVTYADSNDIKNHTWMRKFDGNIITYTMLWYKDEIAQISIGIDKNTEETE